MAIRTIIPSKASPDGPSDRHEGELEAVRAIYGLAMHINEQVIAALGQKRDQFDIYAISALARRGALKQGDLASAIGKSSVFTTRLIDDLQKSNFVERVPHQFDRRVNVVRLTPFGQGAYERMRDCADALARDLFQHTPDDHLQILLGNLRTISERAGFSLNPST